MRHISPIKLKNRGNGGYMPVFTLPAHGQSCVSPAHGKLPELPAHGQSCVSPAHGKSPALHALSALVLPALILFALMPFLALLSGCSQAMPDSTERIGRPNNDSLPISGTWRLENCLGGDAEKDQPASDDPLSGKTIGFSRDSLELAGDYYTNISYKIKRVNKNEYFLHKNIILPEKLNIDDKEIFIVTIYSDDNFLFELIKSGDGRNIAVIDDQYYFMGKVSDDYQPGKETVKEAAVRTEENVEGKNNNVPRSGLLLGVRIPVKTKDGLGDYKYGTYWISSVNRAVRPVLYANDIYLPRMDGFWKLKVDKRIGLYGIEDTLSACKVTSAAKAASSAGMFENVSERVETGVRKAVMYVGNDFVCVENTFYRENADASGAGLAKTLRTLPVDNLSSIDGITISDLAGENGTLAMESAISELLKNTGMNDITLIDSETQAKNFSLYRKTGHWFLKGRIGLNQQGQLPYIDFTLNLLPPANMVAYDVLHIPWTEVKDKLPDAVDIYTSPNVDLAVVLTRSEILIYSIDNKSLSDEPLAAVSLEEGSSVIMAEWCMGDYVTAWEKSFIKNNETVQVENIHTGFKK